MVKNWKGERSFSKLKRIKNESPASRPSTEDRLNNLTLMSIESDLLNDIDFNDIISDFASKIFWNVPIQLKINVMFLWFSDIIQVYCLLHVYY